MRREGKRLVLTNGCFDLLHVGHVRYLQAARAMGDALAVALNSDASVRLLKGPGRPVTPEGERAEVLAALCAVDFVTIFDDERATNVVAQVRPDIYVKGGDYSADPTSPDFPVEARTALEYGAEVRIVPYIPGRSTSELLRRLRA
ncbi:MAG TPA: adenylyltransferase/cytidyltransferase family protein [Chloroflexota bacterium]|nr:adenylyltransferase/cytidyltransferase family protein [Chloroflexota bacterium]